MTDISKTLEHEGLKITYTISDDAATITWRGFCEMRNPEVVIDPFLKTFVATLKKGRVIVDFRPFEFMTSATQAPIMQFLKNLERTKFPTQVIYNSALEWQRVSHRCMKILFRAMVTVQFDCV